MNPRSLYRVGFFQTLALIRSDASAFLKLWHKRPSALQVANILLHPGFLAVLLYRWAHFFYTHRLVLFSRLLHLLMHALTGADISPASVIGERFILLHSVGTVLCARVGRDVIFTAGVMVGGDGRSEDIGAGPGLPLIGDGVFLAPRTLVLGPLRIGDRARLCAGSLILNRDVAPGAKVLGFPASGRRRTTPEEDEHADS